MMISKVTVMMHSLRHHAWALALVLGAAAPARAIPSPPPDQVAAAAADFVQVQGGQFTLGGKTFYFAGSNFYRLGLADAFGGQVVKDYRDGRPYYPQIDAVVANYQRDGIKVLRVWGFSCEGARGQQSGAPLLDAKLRFNEEGMAQLDYVIAAAARQGVKIILPVVNFEPEYCGMDWWVDHVLANRLGVDGATPTPGTGTAEPQWSCLDPSTHYATKLVLTPKECGALPARLSKELFYSDPTMRQAFHTYLHTLLNRHNPYTGRDYKDEPAIMAIEVANEPHTSDYYECMLATPGKTMAQCQSEGTAAYNPGSLVATWVQETAEFIKSIDHHHLVTSGEEGYRANHDDPSCRDRHRWINDGSKGVDFARDVAITALDFMTTHFYPDNWAVPVSDLDWYDRCVISDRARLARQYQKPLIIEETGFSNQGYAGKPDDYRRDRAYYISRMFHYATNAGYQGTLVWQASALTMNDQVAEEDSFTFPIKRVQQGQAHYTLEGLAVVKQAQCFNSRALAPLTSDADCLYLCPIGTNVDDRGLGRDDHGQTCLRPGD